MPDYCPSQSQLSDYLFGRLSDSASDEIFEHLEHCSKCQVVVSELDNKHDEVIERLRRQARELGNWNLPLPSTDQKSSGDSVPHPHRDEERGYASTVLFRSIKPTLRGDRYVLKRFHARGGMGEVWQADDTEIGRMVAVKKMREGYAENQDRFLAEAQIAGQLEHPGIVPVHDLGLDQDGNTFYVMKFVEGQTLKAAIDDYHHGSQLDHSERKVRWSRLLQHFLSMCHAVAYAHSRGVIHRDLKPDNVMLGPYSETLVLDWGLAKIVDQPDAPGGMLAPPLTKGRSSDETNYGSVIGAPPYMSPELAEGRAAEAGPPTDVYLLGAMLYHILTGQPPRRGSSRDEMLELARTVPPVPPRKVKRNVPRPLEAICLKAMAHREQDRYQTAARLANEVQRYLAGEPVTALRERFYERIWRWTRRHHRGVLRTISVGVILGLALFGYQESRRARVSAARQAARDEVQEFQHMADLARYSIANLNPNDERFPYYDLAEGDKAAARAMEIFESWEPELDELSVEFDEPTRAGLKKDLYDLILLRVQAKAADVSGPEEARELLALLEKAGEYGEPSRSYYRLKAQLQNAISDKRPSDGPAQGSQTPTTAWDHFLFGEAYRMQTFELVESDEDRAEEATHQRELLEKAIEEYQAALRDDPEHFWSYYQLGRSYLGLKRPSQAVATLSACIAMRPDSAWAYNSRGLARALSGDFSEALSDLNKARELEPGFAPADLNLGVVYYLQGDFDQARKFLNAVWDRPQETRLIEAAYYLGEIDRKEGDLAAALENFRQVTEERPRFRQAWIRLAEIHFLLGDDHDNDGLEAVDEVIRLSRGTSFNLKSAEGRELRGKHLRNLAARIKAPKDRSRILNLAQKELEAAIGLKPTPDRYDELAEIQTNAGRLTPANQRKQFMERVKENCTLGLEMENDHIDLLDTRAFACYALDQHKEAEEDYEHVTRIPARTFRERLLHVQAHLWIGYYKAAQKDEKSALNEAAFAELTLQELSTEQRADSYSLHHNLACIYAELSKSDAAQKVRLEDLALRYLKKAIDIAKQTGQLESRIDDIKREPAFPDSLKQRAERYALHPSLAQAEKKVE